MCYKACFYSGGHGRKKTHTLEYSHARIGTEKGRDPYENSRRKTRKDGKEASPKKNRTGYETQTTELSKVLTPQTLGKNCRRKNRKTVASSSDHTSPPKSDKPKIPNKEMKLSSCLTVVPYSFESSF